MKSIPLVEHFRVLPDPRRESHNLKRHELVDILTIAIVGVLCGADSWVEIEAFGKEEETRECLTASARCVRDRHRWARLRSIAKVTCTRTIDEASSSESRYFISSLPPDAPEMLRIVRAHWKVETSLHWSLDVSFREDESRVHIGNAQENLSLLRKLSLNLLRNENGSNIGIRAKRLRAGWSEEYLLKVLGVTG